MMRTIGNILDLAANGLCHHLQVLMKILHILNGEQAAANAALIGDNKNRNPGIMKGF